MVFPERLSRACRGLLPDLHGDLDLVWGIRALGRVLQAVAAVGVGESVAAPAAPGHG